MGTVNIVSASAGSGKTYNMAYNYIRNLIEQPTQYRNLLAVTFTNKATEELKQRILLYLHSLACGTKEDFEAKLVADLGFDKATIRKRAAESRNYILHDYNNFSILTIDKFFQRVMRAFIKELGIDLNFNLELQTESLVSQAADRMLDELSADEELRHWVMGFVSENIDEGSGWNIKKSITSLGSELFKEEYRNAAITSKEKPTLKKIIRHYHTEANKLTDAIQAKAKEFVAIMDQHALTVGDFKRGYSGSVASFVQKIASGCIATPSATAANCLTDDSQWCSASSRQRTTIIHLIPCLRPILAAILELLPKVIKAENTANILSKHYRDFALLADLRSRIDAICKEDGILPISDVNDLITKLIANNDAPFIYEKVGNRFTHFMIDEFQDTSRGQWNNFVPLLKNAVAQSAKSPVMLVGDVKQSIYRWRGGDWSLLARDVRKEFDKVIGDPLSKNYRSTTKVVQFNNDLMHLVASQISKRIKCTLPSDPSLLNPQLAEQLSHTISEAYKHLTQQPHDKSGSGYVSALYYELDNEKQHPVIKRIEDLQSRGFRAKDIAILVRTNKEAKLMANALLDHKAASPNSQYTFDFISQDALEIGSAPEARFVVACLTLSTNLNDSLSRATFNDYFGLPFEQPLATDDTDFIQTISLLQPEEAFNEIMLHYGHKFSAQATPYLQALHNTIIDFCGRKIADTTLWLEWWNENGCKKYIALPQEANAITIATIHKSKGLGYTAVILPYCRWELGSKTNSIVWAKPNSPIADNITKFPLEFNSHMAVSEFSESYHIENTMAHVDALNMLYVAVTRAEQELHVMIPASTRGDNIGTLMMEYIKTLRCLTQDSDPDKKQEKEQLFGGTLYDFGELANFNPEEKEKDKKQHKILSESTFATYAPAGKIAVSYDHQRYDNDSVGNGLSPRNQGTLLHRIFEQAATLDDVYNSLGLLAMDGQIAADEITELNTTIDRTITNNHQVAEWFNGSWSEVLNEREIIHQGKIYRPDRVMVQGNEAVIVDYKFGLQENENYNNKIELYANLLSEMGYQKIRGYIWYVTTERVVQVV